MTSADRARLTDRARRRAVDIAVPFVVFFVALGAAWFRLPAPSRGTFWAEDGLIFSVRVLEAGQLPWSVLTSYDGYVHLLPQSLAFLLWHVFPVPIDLMAHAFTLTACTVAASSAVAIYLLTGAWSLNIVGRLLLAFTTVLVPGASYEVLGNLANAHWFLLWLAPFVFLTRPRSWWTSAGLGILSFVILTSEVQSALFTPLLLWKLSDRRRWPLFGGALAGGIVQGIAVLGGGRNTWGSGLPSPVSVLDGYALQVPLLGLSGTGQAASSIVAYSGWSAAFAAIIPFLLCAVWWAWGSRQRQILAVGIIAASFTIWTAGYALNQASAFDFSSATRETLLDGIPLLRYAIVPLMLLFTFVGLAVGSQSLSRAGLQRGVAAALAVLCATLFLVNYRVEVETLRMQGPTWTAGLESAREQCEEASPNDLVNVSIAPSQYWYFPVRCTLVEP